MTPEAQRIAIAKACGWRPWRELPTPETGELMMSFISPNPNEGNRFADDLPDYLNDLNAMHEALQTLEVREQGAFWDHLHEATLKHIFWSDDTNAWNCFDTLNAPAAKWAECFLKTKGLWQE
jgi:hypothetical protein